MTVDRVVYQKLYPYSPYLNEKVGFEASVDKGQDPLEVLSQLKELADKFHKESNPQLDGGNAEPEQLPEQQVEPKEIRIGVLEEDIYSCDSIKVLETYRFLVKSNPHLLTAYNKKMEELLNGLDQDTH